MVHTSRAISLPINGLSHYIYREPVLRKQPCGKRFDVVSAYPDATGALAPPLSHPAGPYTSSQPAKPPQPIRRTVTTPCRRRCYANCLPRRSLGQDRPHRKPMSQHVTSRRPWRKANIRKPLADPQEAQEPHNSGHDQSCWALILRCRLVSAVSDKRTTYRPHRGRPIAAPSVRVHLYPHLLAGCHWRPEGPARPACRQAGASRARKGPENAS